MKSRLINILLLVLFSTSLVAQSSSVSAVGSLSVGKNIVPPNIDINGISFIDPNGNNIIDANELCYIVLDITNKGLGDGVGLSAKISATGNKQAISFSSTELSSLKSRESIRVRIPIESTSFTQDGSIDFDIYIAEPRGFSSNHQYLKIPTKRMLTPLVKVVDYLVLSSGNSTTLNKKENFKVQLLLQNIDLGSANDINLSIHVPQNVYLLDGDQNINISTLSPNDTKIIEYTLVVNNEYNSNKIPLHFNLSERYGVYAKDTTITLTINEALSSNYVHLQAIDTGESTISTASLHADVDINIKNTGKIHNNRYAIIIGNEDYCSYNTTLKPDANVSFAVNDAKIFKKYCINYFGVPEDNICLLLNKTSAILKNELSNWQEIISMNKDSAEVIFYYAGHGLPDEKTKDPYLIPVDVSIANMESAIALSTVYNGLASTNASKITIFLDACFSGGGRNASLSDTRGIVIVPKESNPRGKTVVFSATNAEQSALPYNGKHHGMFTYWLLKKIQETSGECSYDELSQYLQYKVAEQSLKVNKKRQNPTVVISPILSDEWKHWTIK